MHAIFTRTKVTCRKGGGEEEEEGKGSPHLLNIVVRTRKKNYVILRGKINFFSS